MTQLETYRLLILTESQNEAEQLISLFRNAGHATRAHRLTSSQDLHDHLDDHEWDLLISDDKNNALDFSLAIQIIKDTDHDIPCILLSENNEAETLLTGFEQGASDVIASTNEQHLLAAAKREITSVRIRQQGRKAQTQLLEATQRADQLMSDTQEAIAYIADGMHIEANDAYAEIFGYQDAEELEAMPMIDLIAESDQEKFKAFLRHYSRTEGDQAELNFSGIRQDDAVFSAMMVFSSSSFDGEPCTQILIRTNESGDSANSTNSSGTQDTLSGLPNRYYLQDQLKASMLQLASGHSSACLLLINIDDFPELLDKHRISGGDAIIKDCAELIQPKLRKDDILTRFGYGSLGLIVHINAEDALNAALELCKSIEDHICELENQTAQYTCTIGIAPINPSSPADIIDNAYAAITQVHHQQEKSTAAVYIPEAEPEPSLASGDSTLEEALELKRIHLLYQPVISLRGDSKEHYEVFSRIITDEDEELLPLDFLSDVQDTKLDRWIILEATKTLASHHANGHDTRIIINLTPFALADESLVGWIGVALKAANLPPHSIIWQFSEADISRNLKQAKELLSGLSELGCMVSINQFGRTGSDPLKTLKHIKTDYVKIDGDYILGLQDNQGDPQVLKALINSINEQKALSIVPKVENASILATLWQVGVNYIQGNYLQAPGKKMDYEFTEIT
jgi:diguanylate cyclase (GGDEF)-like protein/PAS domain S-box-containing protein